MKKSAIVIILTIVLTSVLFTACGGGKEEYSNITAGSNPYCMGSQDIVITASTVSVDGPKAKFKQTISPSDIEVGQALKGKTVTKVVYNSETSITVTLEGNTSTSGDKAYGTITVKQSGMASKGKSTCTVTVRPPEMKVTGYSYGGGGSSYRVKAKLVLPVGAFTDKATLENVTLSDGATGDMTVKLSEGLLEIDIEKCNTANPTIHLTAETTTFGKEISIKLSVGGSTVIQ